MNWGKKKKETEQTPQRQQHTQPTFEESEDGNRSVEPVASQDSRGGGRDALPELLVRQGKVTVAQVRQALKKAQETGTFFGDILADENILDENTLVGFLTKYCRIPHLSLMDYVIDREAVSLIPPDICWKYHLLPVDKLGRNLTIAMVNPLNHEALDVIKQLCPTLRVRPILCSHDHFEAVAEKLFGEKHEHDETIWSQLPHHIAAPAAADTKHTSPLIEPTEQATPVQAKAIVSDDEQQDQSTAAEKIVADINSNNLLDTVFHDIAPDMAPDWITDESGNVHATELEALEGVMHEYTDAMIESMRETYVLLKRKIPFFDGLYPEDIAKIFSWGKVFEYPPGHVLFEKGEPGDNMFVILSGRVEIRDQNKIITTLYKGESFGEMAQANDMSRSSDAITLAPSSLLALNLHDIRNNMPPRVAIQLLFNIVASLSKRLRESNCPTGA